jgi:hypothetical protein
METLQTIGMGTADSSEHRLPMWTHELAKLSILTMTNLETRLFDPPITYLGTLHTIYGGMWRSVNKATRRSYKVLRIKLDIDVMSHYSIHMYGVVGSYLYIADIHWDMLYVLEILIQYSCNMHLI